MFLLPVRSARSVPLGPSIRDHWTQNWETLLSWVYPHSCQICGQEPAVPGSGFVGARCRQDLAWLPEATLESRPRELTANASSSPPRSCDFVRSGLWNQGSPMNALKAYKYERARHFEPFLAQLVEEWLQRAPVGGTWTALIPAPISRRRRRERGFNQATELAKSAQKVLQIPIWDNILQRRHTRPQAGLDRLERSQNLRGALAVNPRGVDPIGGAFLLFDDVLTTGATLNACAHALLEAGAHRVGALTLLRER